MYGWRFDNDRTRSPEVIRVAVMLYIDFAEAKGGGIGAFELSKLLAMGTPTEIVSAAVNISLLMPHNKAAS